jgi:hypothetical protein
MADFLVVIVDSVSFYQAYYNGLAVERLDDCCVHYHIEHDCGSGWTPEGGASLWRRLAERGIPCLSNQQFNELIFELQNNAEKNQPNIYNDSGWGFESEDVSCGTVVYKGSPNADR